MAISVFQMFKIGIGPSSSHTVGPMKAAKDFIMKAHSKGLLENSKSNLVMVDLFGSLALTGKGHATDKAIIMGLFGEDPENIDTSTIYDIVSDFQTNKKVNLLKQIEKPFNINFFKHDRLPYHTNGMIFRILDEHDIEIFKDTYYSVGGGFVVNQSEISNNCSNSSNGNDGSNGNYTPLKKRVPFPFKKADELFQLCRENNLTISEIMIENEKEFMSECEIKSKLNRIWEVMYKGIERGLNSPGMLPGPLLIERRAPVILKSFNSLESNAIFTDPMNFLNYINMWALAVSEENSIGGQVVTAPTNGSAGVIPAVIQYYLKFHSGKYPDKIHDFLLTAAAIGIIFKINATVSGAEGGCQAEIGVASSMAAAGLTAALGGNLIQIENAAEIAMEHFIGMTCDPVGGVVQIPCIERNAVGAVKAVNSVALALNDPNKHKVSLDRIVQVMRETGEDMKTKYKETSKGGLARILHEDFKKGLKLMKQRSKHAKDNENEVDLLQHNTLC